MSDKEFKDLIQYISSINISPSASRTVLASASTSNYVIRPSFSSEEILSWYDNDSYASYRVYWPDEESKEEKEKGFWD